MVIVSNQLWESLERWRSTLFLVAGVLFVINAGIVATGIALDSGRLISLLGQAFVGAGWAAALFGLLGLYPELADRRPRLVQAGAVFAVIGVVTFTVMAVASLLYYLGIPDGEITPLVPIFLVGVVIGSILSFLAFSTASLRTDVLHQRIGSLLLILPLIVVTNIFRGIVLGVETATVTLVIVIALAVVTLAIGYLLRTERTAPDRQKIEPPRGPTTK